ncbi:hypothetical protein, partial [Brevundimonas sp. UBA5713]|uniref:hypothetical protein n=1 Tax=Brevundimonas sp. UBA5713 TaxID=1946130 RepID=UPI0025C1AE45
ANWHPPKPPAPPPVPPYHGCVGGGCTPPSPPTGGGCYGCAPPAPPVVCCGGGNLNVNVNINNVSAAANANASANASARAYGGARAGATVIVGGGGGAYFNVDQPYPLTAQGLSVEGRAAEVVRTPVVMSRRQEKRVRIQAVCLDDRNVPHPASQVRPGKDVAGTYNGEIYRCIAGTKLQYTITDIDGGPGETLICNKRQALWYDGKQLECRPERPARDCNERSLLRRYGAGVKELLLVREETYTEYREDIVERSVISAGSMMMDGGVGGRVF